jgi:RNA polymerase sigma-70 factor (ECF subfamily)
LDTDSPRSRDHSSHTEGKPRESIEIQRLTRRLVRGEEAAYRAFYDAYFNRLLRYLLVVTAGDEEASREALQGMLVRLVKYVKVFSNDEIFWSWLTVLARSALADNRRKHRRYSALLDRFSRHIFVGAMARAEVDGDSQLNILLEKEIISLPADEQHLIEKKYAQQISVRGIAEDLRVSQKAVESSLVRIRKKLKRAVLSRLRNEPPS